MRVLAAPLLSFGRTVARGHGCCTRFDEAMCARATIATLSCGASRTPFETVSPAEDPSKGARSTRNYPRFFRSFSLSLSLSLSFFLVRRRHFFSFGSALARTSFPRHFVSLLFFHFQIEGSQTTRGIGIDDRSMIYSPRCGYY